MLASAQLSTREIPIGFKYDFDKEKIPVIIMSAIDVEKLKAEDEEERSRGLNLPPRFGFKHPVNLNLTKQGVRHTLDNGDKLYQLAIACPGAASINLLYDKFWLPAGAKFFVYGYDKKHHIGAFTTINNKGTKDNIEGFATELIYSDTIILEYYLPKSSSEEGIISISGVIQGYRNINSSARLGYGNVPGQGWDDMGFNWSGRCHVNINCPEGNAWQNEKRAIALVVSSNGIRHCTGALINNTNNDFRPLFLTAQHCLQGNLNNWMFFWGYELPPTPNPANCNDRVTTAPQAFSTLGARLLASIDRFIGTDFALLELIEDPIHLHSYTPSYTPYYLGWDRTGIITAGGVGIHHPRGDVKKISTYSTEPVGYTAEYWRVIWIRTQNERGTVEEGSSGSPLINSSRRVIGQLSTGSDLGCLMSIPYGNYGRFDRSWTGGGTNTTRLSNWLDPTNTGRTTLDGINYNCNSTTVSGTINQNRVVRCNTINANNATVTPTGNLNLRGNVINIGPNFTVQSGGGLTVTAE